MNVRGLINYLESFEDQDAEVLIVKHTSGNSHYEQGGTIEEVPFNQMEHVDYTDFRGNQYVKKDSDHYNKRFLLIGSTDN